MVIAGVAERSPDRIAHAGYLDAFVPSNGETILDLATPERVAWMREQVAAAGDGWLILCPPLGSFGLADADAAWLAPLAGPQPLKTFEEPIRLANPAAQAIPRTFIRCVEYPAFKSQVERAQTARDWHYCEIPTSHLAMVTEPAKLAELLLDIGGHVTASV